MPQRPALCTNLGENYPHPSGVKFPQNSPPHPQKHAGRQGSFPEEYGESSATASELQHALLHPQERERKQEKNGAGATRHGR